ncbi:transposase [Streptosporangium roseum]|uniref:transposase n=1 Tax=Streptosporangium roseum TaxID=2001 RepID=UPI003320F903
MNGRKWFVITDTTGLLVTVSVMAASRQERDGAKTTLLSAYLTTPIRHVFADQGFAGRLVDWAREKRHTPIDYEQRIMTARVVTGPKTCEAIAA